MKKRKLKKPSDYPQFYCRMTPEDKEEIDLLIKAVCSKRLENMKDDELKPKRNELIIEVLKSGLKRMLK